MRRLSQQVMILIYYLENSSFKSKKGEDSGTESDQMEKKAPESVVSENEDEGNEEEVDDEANDTDESILDESVLAGGPSVKKSEDETLENGEQE